MSTSGPVLVRWIGTVAIALAASLLVPAGATAAQARPTLSVSDARPIRGEIVKIRADLPGRGSRPIRLQRRTDDRWVTVASRRSNRAVATTFTRRMKKTATFRAVAGRGAERRVSGRVTVRPQRQSARLVTVQRVTTGDVIDVAAVLTPARTGRQVAFQRRDAAGWRTFARTRQARTGQAVATVRVDRTARYRVVAAAHRGAARLTSPTVMVTATTAPTPDPPAPTLRCDLPAGGTVSWGHDDAGHAMREVARLDIATDDGLPITRKDVYSRSTLTLTEPGTDPVVIGARLRVRGNSTSAATVKLPYKVKLDQATIVRGMPLSKDWVLLANFYDRAMLRNDVAFEAARRLGMPWTPRMQPVEVFLNGELRGLYQLGEGIEVESARVELADGAVLLEADAYEDTDPSFRTARNLQVFAKSTENEDVVAATAERVRRIEDVLYADHFAHPTHGYRSCLDVDSFVDAYLLSELTKNIDSAFNNSVWMVLGADGRLAMGPAWDFDQGLGNRHNCGIADPTGWFVNRHWLDEQPVTPKCFPTQMRGPDGHWYQRLMTDPWFVTQVRARWAQVHVTLAGLSGYVDETAATIQAAAERNFAPRVEGGAGMPLGETLLEKVEHHVFHGSWAAETSALSTWLEARVAWLDAQFG